MPIALASDTLSIAIMEIVDNVIILASRRAGGRPRRPALLGQPRVRARDRRRFAFPVNRWLIARGKGHVAVHETGIHGGPPTRVVAVIAAIAFVFGAIVLIAEAF